MAISARRLYWDSCVFLGLINQEAGKVNDSTAVWREAERGEALIYTSFFTFAEVFKVKGEGPAKPLTEDEDKKIETLLRQKWIRPILVDERIGVLARRLMRSHQECKKPSDGIHLASALVLNVDQMHTYDSADLLILDGKVSRLDGKMLNICPPKPRPKPPSDIRDIFEDENE